jgi:hypothetical protein
MQISTAYFAGVGTVIVAVAAGLGGGYFAANLANTPPAVSKLERRMSAEPISVAAAPVQPTASQATASPAAASTAAAPSPLQTQSQPQAEAVAASDKPVPATSAAVAEEKPAMNATVAQPVQPAPQPARSAEQKPVEQTSEKAAAPREAYAKARESDVKRAEAERRRAERRQAWAERRHGQQPREQDLDAVEERVREITEPRRIRIREESESREVFAEPAERDSPRIRLFGQDD